MDTGKPKLLDHVINVMRIKHFSFLCVMDCRGAERSGFVVGTGCDLSLRQNPTEPPKSQVPFIETRFVASL